MGLIIYYLVFFVLWSIIEFFSMAIISMKPSLLPFYPVYSFVLFWTFFYGVTIYGLGEGHGPSIHRIHCHNLWLVHHPKWVFRHAKQKFLRHPRLYGYGIPLMFGILYLMDIPQFIWHLCRLWWVVHTNLIGISQPMEDFIEPFEPTFRFL